MISYGIDPIQDIDTALFQVANHPIDFDLTEQERLDLSNKQRTSLFPWRGQFSPELVELLLETHAAQGSEILDPFAGSGTTLLESARRNHSSYGVEINPAAFAMASTAHFINISHEKREAFISEAEEIIRRFFPPVPDLFTWAMHGETRTAQELPLSEAIQGAVTATKEAPLLQNIIANTVMRYIGYEGKGSHASIFDAFYGHAKIVRMLPHKEQISRMLLCDARCIPLPSATIDVVITSPPYVNVFNYHQNFRRAMELFGWNLLRVSQSEIGSNRKHRSNRLLTVVQYTIDMYHTLREIRRLLRPTGRAIVVIGRESRVRGISFDNTLILGALAVAGAGFRLVQRQERKFTNKFGVLIYEDLLHLVPSESIPGEDNSIPRLLSQTILKEAITKATGQDVLRDLAEAYERAFSIRESPPFHVENAKAK